MDEIVSLMKNLVYDAWKHHEIPQMKHYGKNVVRQKFRTAKIPYGENSIRQKKTYGEKSYSESAYGESSYGENSYGGNSGHRCLHTPKFLKLSSI